MKRNYALDGIKGVGIIAVLLYHFFAHTFPGGFIGVEIFFTIAGFLTSVSLLKGFALRAAFKNNIRIGSARQRAEGQQPAGFRRFPGALADFYGRRLIRLVPALLFMVPAVITAAWFINKDALVGIGRRVVAVFTFTYNYYEIFSGGSYFDQTVPQLLEPLWFVSLCIQFYLIIPLFIALAVGIAHLFAPMGTQGIFSDARGADGRRKHKGANAQGGSRRLRSQFSRSLYGYSKYAAWIRAVGKTGFILSSAAACVSAFLMGVLFGGGWSSPTRVYFGFDTHCFGLFTGAAFAFVLLWSYGRKLRGQVEQAFLESTRTPRRKVLESLAEKMDISHLADSRAEGPLLTRVMLPVLSFVSLIAVIAAAYTLRDKNYAFYGALFAASILTVIMLWGTLSERSWMRSLFAWRPLRLAGQYSYGLYIWHWPLLILAQLSLPGLRGKYQWVFVLVSFSLTLVMAYVSAHYVEKPASRIYAAFISRIPGAGPAESSQPSAGRCGMEGAGTADGTDEAADGDKKGDISAVTAGRISGMGTAARRKPAVNRAVICFILVALWTGCGFVIAYAPAQTSIQNQLEAQAAVLKNSGKTSGTASQDVRRAPAPEPSPSHQTSAPAEAQPSGSPFTPAQQPVMPAGTEMTAIGDSVMLGSATAVQQRFPGIIIDAKVSRFLHEGPGVITSLKAKGLLRKYIVIGLSTNGAGTPQQWENIYNAAGPGHVFLVVNAHMDRTWTAAANQNVRDFVSRHPQDALMVNWDAAAAAHPGLLASDGIHAASSEGGSLYAQTIYDSLLGWLQDRGK